MAKRTRGWLFLDDLSKKEIEDLGVQEEDGVVHTSKKKNQMFTEDVVRATFMRDKKSNNNRSNILDPVDLDDGGDDGAWEREKTSKKAGKGKSTLYGTRHGESKLEARLGAGREEVDSGLKSGMEGLVARAKHWLGLEVVPAQVACRADMEASILGQALRRIREGASALIYVSGQPGTGKTLTVHRVIDTVRRMRDQNNLPHFHCVLINCLVDLPAPAMLFQRFYADLTGEVLSPTKAQRVLTEKWYTTDNQAAPQYVLLLLDELDSLLTKNTKQASNVIHTVLEWMSRPNSRLLVIGISNTIDLLERLDSKTSSRGAIVHKETFRPYTWHDIVEILSARLRCAIPDGESKENIPLFELQALELCAKKTASDRGDVRRALQVCRLAIERRQDSTLQDLDSAFSSLISPSDIHQCLKELRSGSFAMALSHASILEKLFMWSFAQECCATGDSHSSFKAIELRLSSYMARFESQMPCLDPGTSVWQRVCDSLLVKHMLLGNSRSNIRCPDDMQPDDIIFFLTKDMETETSLKFLSLCIK